MIGYVTDLGSALLDAINNRDAEKLTRIENTQEKVLLDLNRMIKQKEIEIAENTIDALGYTKKSIEKRKDRFTKLYDDNISGYEIAAITLGSTAQGLKIVSSILQTFSGTVQLFPDATTGTVGPLPYFTVDTPGGEKVGESLGKFATGISITADVLSLIGDIVSKVGEWDRRRKEWGYEKEIAGYDLEEVNLQIKIAGIQIGDPIHTLRGQRACDVMFRDGPVDVEDV